MKGATVMLDRHGQRGGHDHGFHPGPHPRPHPEPQPRPHPEPQRKDGSSQGKGTQGNPQPAPSPDDSDKHSHNGETDTGDTGADKNKPFRVQVDHALDIDFDRKVKVKKTWSLDEKIVTVLPFTGTPQTITLYGHKAGTAAVVVEYTDSAVDRLSVDVTQ
jgi:hypothetical protein